MTATNPGENASEQSSTPGRPSGSTTSAAGRTPGSPAEGQVLNLAVRPAVEVEVKVFSGRSRRSEAGDRPCRKLSARRSAWTPKSREGRAPASPIRGRQSAASRRTSGLEIRLYSPVPGRDFDGHFGGRLRRAPRRLERPPPERRSWKELARLAHQVETNNLGQQSGIQDQIAAAHGGISFIHMPRYPESRVTAVGVGPALWSELERRLCLVYLGKPHRSSAMHERVIAELESGGPLFARSGSWPRSPGKPGMNSGAAISNPTAGP